MCASGALGALHCMMQRSSGWLSVHDMLVVPRNRVAEKRVAAGTAMHAPPSCFSTRPVCLQTGMRPDFTTDQVTLLARQACQARLLCRAASIRRWLF